MSNVTSVPGSRHQTRPLSFVLWGIPKCSPSKLPPVERRPRVSSSTLLPDRRARSRVVPRLRTISFHRGRNRLNTHPESTSSGSSTLYMIFPTRMVLVTVPRAGLAVLLLADDDDWRVGKELRRSMKDDRSGDGKGDDEALR